MPQGTPPAINTRIVGGTATDIRKFPFAAQLIEFNSVTCGGSILTERHILTAAHCVATRSGKAINTRVLSVRVGATEAAVGGHLRKIIKITLHEGYNARSSYDNDIAILLLESPIYFGGTVDKAALPPKGYEVPLNVAVTSVGWGTLDTGHLSHTLQEVTVPTVDPVLCTQRYSERKMLVTSNMVCAGLIGVGGVDSCQGDSGGPLIYQHVVIGVVSWGIDCGNADFPGVYAKVSSYTDWIGRNVKISRAVSVHKGIISLLGPLIILLKQKIEI